MKFVSGNSNQKKLLFKTELKAFLREIIPKIVSYNGINTFCGELRNNEKMSFELIMFSNDKNSSVIIYDFDTPETKNAKKKLMDDALKDKVDIEDFNDLKFYGRERM